MNGVKMGGMDMDKLVSKQDAKGRKAAAKRRVDLSGAALVAESTSTGEVRVIALWPDRIEVHDFGKRGALIPRANVGAMPLRAITNVAVVGSRLLPELVVTGAGGGMAVQLQAPVAAEFQRQIQSALMGL